MRLTMSDRTLYEHEGETSKRKAQETFPHKSEFCHRQAYPVRRSSGMTDGQDPVDQTLDTTFNGKSKPNNMLQAKWEAMEKRLIAFKEQHGHCLVPNRYVNDPALGAWVSTQRRQVSLPALYYTH